MYSRKIKLRLLSIASLVIIAMLSMVMPVLAQEIFISPDEDWQVEVRRGYDIETDSNDVGILSSRDATLELYGPVVLESFGYEGYDDPVELMEDVADVEEYELEELSFSNDVAGNYIVILRRDDLAYIGVTKVFSDGSLGLALISLNVTDDDDLLLEVLEITDSFNSVSDDAPPTRDGGTKGSTTTPNRPTTSVDTLRDFDADWEDAVAELEDEGLIPADGELVFFEDYAFISGAGGNYTSLASRASVQNVVMAGELTFTPDGDEYQTCSLAARVVSGSDNVANIFLEFGLNTDEELYIFDAFGPGEDESLFTAVGSADPEDVLHYLAIIADDQISLYIDGELAIEGLEVDERAGSFGVLLRGDGRDATCETRNTWAYRFGGTGGVCEVTSDGSINKRSGPGTDFDREGRLSGNTPTEAIAQSEPDNEDFIWYQLEDDTWVREDLVSVSGPCDELPIED